MAHKKPFLFSTLLAASVCFPLACPSIVLADDYSDLLDILRAKGSLTQHEYDTLLSKHIHLAAEQQHVTRTA
ncbi:MAG: porin, partial [Acetobacter cibinongensis]